MLCKCKFIYQLIIYAEISTGNWENDSKLMQKIIGQSPIFNLIKSRKKKNHKIRAAVLCWIRTERLEEKEEED